MLGQYTFSLTNVPLSSNQKIASTKKYLGAKYNKDATAPNMSATASDVGYFDFGADKQFFYDKARFNIYVGKTFNYKTALAITAASPVSGKAVGVTIDGVDYTYTIAASATASIVATGIAGLTYPTGITATASSATVTFAFADGNAHTVEAYNSDGSGVTAMTFTDASDTITFGIDTSSDGTNWEEDIVTIASKSSKFVSDITPFIDFAVPSCLKRYVRLSVKSSSGDITVGDFVAAVEPKN